MNQLTLDQAKTELIEMMTPQHEETYKATSIKDGMLQHCTLTFIAFCHAYADHLLHVNAYNMYGMFIGKFNEIIEQDEIYNHFKSVQTNPRFFANGFFNHNYEKLLIRDKRYKVEDRYFARESDFELELVRQLEDYFGNELDVKQQQNVGYGRADVLIDNSIAIELKRLEVKRKDVYQAFEYSFGENIEEVVLIGKEISKEVVDIAEKLNISCYRYDFLYERSNVLGYPLGFCLTKIWGIENSKFESKVTKETSSDFFFSNYNPLFNFPEKYEEYVKVYIKVSERSRESLELSKKAFLDECKQAGYDTSKGLESVIESAKEVIEGARS